MTFTKGQTPWNKGIKFEAIRGKNHFLYGKHRTEETKRKISQARKGIPSWKKGLTAKDDSRIASGSRCGNWKGGKVVVKGHIKVRNTEHPHGHNGYVYEHRLVMEEYLGRYLNPWEVVHHINGIKSDNRLENLELVKNKSNHNTEVEKVYAENVKLKKRIKQLERELNGHKS